MHKECICKEFCSQTRLGGEICSSDVNTHKGRLLTEKYHQIRRKQYNYCTRENSLTSMVNLLNSIYCIYQFMTESFEISYL